MPLTLTVLRCPPSVAPEVRQVTGGEFSLGRGADNDWVLPDPSKHLSKRHCVIAYRKGAWQVAGTSTNGTFVNRDQTPLESRAPQVLSDGDRLTLGEYEIEVRLTEEAQASWGRAAPAGKPDPFGNPFDDDPFAPAPARAQIAAPRLGSNPYEPVLPPDFDPLLPDKEDVFPAPTRSDHMPATSDAIDLPMAKSVLPDDWDLDDLRPPPPPPPIAAPQPQALILEPAPTPPVPAATPPGADLLEAFLRGAGLENVALPDPVQVMEHLGAAFRAMVSGIRQTLIARSEVKREFRIEATVIRSRGNNLLKFSANDDDALVGLLGAGRRTDMAAEEAVTDALRDIRLHELATMTAMQTAVRALVVRLGPDQLQNAKDQGGGLALLGNRKAKAWDAYTALHAEVLRGLSDDFDSLFGKRFALAYEQAMQELTARPSDDRR
jgi:type VI secretion system protein ImpI/type VI secretion system protein